MKYNTTLNSLVDIKKKPFGSIIHYKLVYTVPGNARKQNLHYPWNSTFFTIEGDK